MFRVFFISYSKSNVYVHEELIGDTPVVHGIFKQIQPRYQLTFTIEPVKYIENHYKADFASMMMHPLSFHV